MYTSPQRRQRYINLPIDQLVALARVYGRPNLSTAPSREGMVNFISARPEMPIESIVLYVMNNPQQLDTIAINNLGMFIPPEEQIDEEEVQEEGFPPRKPGEDREVVSGRTTRNDRILYLINNASQYNHLLNRTVIPQLTAETVQQFTDYELFSLTGKFIPSTSRTDLVNNYRIGLMEATFYIPLDEQCYETTDISIGYGPLLGDNNCLPLEQVLAQINTIPRSHWSRLRRMLTNLSEMYLNADPYNNQDLVVQLNNAIASLR